MKAVFTIIAVAASLAAAADSPASMLPPCVQTCLGKLMTGATVGGCSQLDFGCVCNNKNFIADISCCIIENNCDQASKDATIKLAHQLCDSKGAKIPDRVECKKATSSQAASAGASSVSDAVSTPTSTVTKGSSNSHSSAAATSTSNVAPVNGAGMLGAAAVLAFAL